MELRKERGVCFEDVVAQIYEDNVLDIIKHPNEEKYPEQKIYKGKHHENG